MTRTRTWLVSGAASIALVSVLAWLADPAVLRLALAPGVLEALLLALVLLQIEGLCTALRVQWLAPGSRFIAALEVTGWWVVSLALLPARLGEVAGVHLLVRCLGTTLGSALNSLLMQRLLDALLLALAGATVIAALTVDEPVLPATVLLLAAAVGLWLVLRLERVFGATARGLVRWRQQPLARRALGVALGGRHAARAVRSPALMLRLFAGSAIKWCATLAAVVVVIVALVPLSLPAALTVAILFSLAAVVPLQTVGGIGIGEAVFAGGMQAFGVDLATGAGCALVLRAVVLLAPCLFFVLSVGAGRLAAGRLAARA